MILYLSKIWPKVNKSTIVSIPPFSMNDETHLTELPENSPRYVILSYELDHGDRKSFPLVLINWAPTTSEMSLLTLHASAFIDFQNAVSSISLW